MKLGVIECTTVMNPMQSSLNSNFVPDNLHEVLGCASDSWSTPIFFRPSPHAQG